MKSSIEKSSTKSKQSINSEVYAWGLNDQGQMGLGETNA